MSSWTYVYGTVLVAPGGSGQHAKTFVLNEVLDHLPLVPGSEGPMTWQVLPGQHCHSWCNHDEFGMASNLHRHAVLGSRRYGWETQELYIVVLEGLLRDTVYEDTLRAFVNWMNRLSKRVRVEDMLVRVWGQKRTWGEYGKRIFSGAGFWGRNFSECISETRDAEGDGLDVRRSSNWRYDVMPDSGHWPDILVNLVPGGTAMAKHRDLLFGNCLTEEYLVYDHENDRYSGVDESVLKQVEDGYGRVARVLDWLHDMGNADLTDMPRR